MDRTRLDAFVFGARSACGSGVGRSGLVLTRSCSARGRATSTGVCIGSPGELLGAARGGWPSSHRGSGARGRDERSAPRACSRERSCAGRPRSGARRSALGATEAPGRVGQASHPVQRERNASLEGFDPRASRRTSDERSVWCGERPSKHGCAAQPPRGSARRSFRNLHGPLWPFWALRISVKASDRSHARVATARSHVRSATAPHPPCSRSRS
jgi:hypothetical protein